MLKLDSTALEVHVMNAIDAFAKQAMGFTKYDITVAVRKSVKHTTVPHSDVKAMVEDLMRTHYTAVEAQDPTFPAVRYTSVSKRKVTGPANPVLGMSLTKAISSTGPAKIGMAGSGGAAISLGSKPPYYPPLYSVLVKANKRGLCVPTKIVDQAMVVKNTAQLTQVRVQFPLGTFDYCVDKNGNIAITHDKLNQMFSNNSAAGTEYKIDLYNGYIRVNKSN